MLAVDEPNRLLVFVHLCVHFTDRGVLSCTCITRLSTLDTLLTGSQKLEVVSVVI
jgi:hypothetical protein